MTIDATHAVKPAAARIIPTVEIAELDRDPHAVFRRYRPETPVVRRVDGSLIAMRAADFERLLADPRTRQMETELFELRGIVDGPLYDIFQYSMLFSNEPEHRRRRAPLSRAFAFRMIAALRPGIRAAATAILDRVAPDGEMNLLDDFAAQVPARTIATIVGLPEADIPDFTRWVYDVSLGASFSFNADDIGRMQQSAGHITDYLAQMLADRRAAPRDDFLTDFVKAVDEGGELTPIEALAQLITIVAAGSDTTRASMTIQTALLLGHREQWDAVCQNPELIPGAVLEALRFEPSIGGAPRFTLEDIELDGVILPAGRILSLSAIAAMRDPAVYAEPDRFNIYRKDHPRWHYVFGGGAHRCLGEALAKAELEEGLAALAARFPTLEVVGEPLRVTGHSGVRRVSSLRVAWPQP
ncbi:MULTISPECIES: cytochrome P450 [Rhodomicrobium]|uniref:cytochrome P450 n=1 Tax=Rhodomicrobium TaxID=1068 RepID=UPI001FD93293|nr:MULTISPECIES: cytochrome P450 [Rhodomicrobium]